MGDGTGANRNRGLSYSTYMLFLFLAKALCHIGSEPDAATELAKRTGNLIEWNIINYQNGVKGNETAMATALQGEGRFRLVDMKTDFGITTTVDLRMLFLSMPFALNFSDRRGIGMPGTMPVAVTDYRGY